jgi:prevent-host-death family protein
MSQKMSATEARVHFGELMRQAVESHEPIIIERGGEPHIVVLSIAEYKRLKRAQQQHADWKSLVDRARKQIRTDLGDRELPPPEEILQQLREERDAKLLALR